MGPGAEPEVALPFIEDHSSRFGPWSPGADRNAAGPESQRGKDRSGDAAGGRADTGVSSEGLVSNSVAKAWPVRSGARVIGGRPRAEATRATPPPPFPCER